MPNVEDAWIKGRKRDCVSLAGQKIKKARVRHSET